MSKFFEHYNAVLEKNLQRVRLKVDPLNKYAEDFGQYDGYVGYILAETEDEIKFFSNNKTLILPKKAVVVEGLVSGIAGGATNFMQGAAGQAPKGFMGAAGSIARGVAGTAARAVFGPQVTGSSATPQAAAGTDAKQAAQNAALGKQVGMTKIPQEMWGKSFNVKDKKGTAYIYARGKDFYITQIKLTNQSGRVLESKSFKDIADFYSCLFEQNAPTITVPSTPPAPSPAPSPSAPAGPAVPATPPPPPPQQQQQQQQKQQQTPTPPAKSGIRYVDITNKPEFINEGSFITIVDIKSKEIFQGYGQLTRIPERNEFSIGFAAQQP